MDRKKELKEQYKQMKPDMGVFIIKSANSNKCTIETTQNLKGYINRTKFQLGAGSHMIKELQKEWNEFGQEKFTIEILEKLECDKDESKTDYTEDLALLQMIWEEKLLKESYVFYKK